MQTVLVRLTFEVSDDTVRSTCGQSRGTFCALNSNLIDDNRRDRYPYNLISIGPYSHSSRVRRNEINVIGLDVDPTWP